MDSALEKSTYDKCDKYDYLIAVSCGLAAGIVDALFIGVPGQGKLGRFTDKSADGLVQKIAKMVWNGDGRTNRPKHMPDTLEKSISYLEQSFPVNYDARYAADLKDANGLLAHMSPKNHHLLSLAHSPDIVGLLFSILDQFTGLASFVEDGKLIRLVPVTDARNNKITYMQGTRFESKIFCGICNWLGHLASDLCGSSSTRRAGKTGRGAGLPMPFYGLFLMMDFGNFDGASFADVAVKIFEEGYDLRHGAAMAIPVMIEELSIRVIWALKRHFYHKKDWKDCMPSSKHADLRMMLIVGNAALCMVDGLDAAIRTGIKGGNPIMFILHLNLIAWGRLLILIFQELRIRFGSIIDQEISRYFSEIGINDRYALKQYYDRMNMLDQKLDQRLKDFVINTEKQYQLFVEEVNRSLNPAYGTSEQRRIASVDFARKQGISEKRIMKTPEELRYWLGEGWI